MQAPEHADRIVGDVCSKLEVDRNRLLGEVRVAFEPGAYWHDLIEAERVSGEVVADAWEDIATDCQEALADVREQYLVQAARVIEAQNDLQDHGVESWIARAVIHDVAFGLAWDILDEQGLLTELDDPV